MVFDADADLPPSLGLVRTSADIPTYLVTLPDAPADHVGVLQRAGVRVIAAADLEAGLRALRTDGIRSLLNSALPCDPCPMLKTGMKVEVVHGPLKGVTGRLQRKGSQARLVLSVDLIGRGVSVQVDAADVRAL